MTNYDRYKLLIDSYKNEELDKVRELIDPGVVMENMAPEETPIAGDRHGVDGFLDYLDVAASPTCEIIFLETGDWLENGDHVIVTGRERYRILSTGKVAETPFIHETRWKDGKLVYWREFYDTAKMRDAYRPD